MEVLKKHGVALNFTLAQMEISDPHIESSEVLGDPDDLAWQVRLSPKSPKHHMRIMFLLALFHETVRLIVKCLECALSTTT